MNDLFDERFHIPVPTLGHLHPGFQLLGAAAVGTKKLTL
jgi:hypothetical protein